MPSEFDTFSAHPKDAGPAVDNGTAANDSHLGAMLKEALHCKTYTGCAETIAVGALAAAVGARLLMPIFRAGLKDAAISAERTGLEAISGKAASELPNLSRGEAGGQSFRYFEQSEGAGPSNLYRIPANGLRIKEQTLTDVQRYAGAGEWTSGHRTRLINQMIKGWFDEKKDAITVDQAGKLMSTIEKSKL